MRIRKTFFLNFCILFIYSCNRQNDTMRKVDMSKSNADITVGQFYQIAHDFPRKIPTIIDMNDSCEIVLASGTSKNEALVLNGFISDSVTLLHKRFNGDNGLNFIFKVEKIESMYFLKAFSVDKYEKFDEYTYTINKQKGYSLLAIDGCFVADSQSNSFFYINTHFNFMSQEQYGNHNDVTRILVCDNHLFPKLVYKIRKDTLYEISEIHYDFLNSKKGKKVLTEYSYNFEGTSFQVSQISSYKVQQLNSIFEECKKRFSPKKYFPDYVMPEIPLWVYGGEYLRKIK